MLPATRVTTMWPMVWSKTRNPRIRAGKHGGERLLFVDGMFFEDGQVAANGCALIGGETLVALD
jgi:hypothetical protein